MQVLNDVSTLYVRGSLNRAKWTPAAHWKGYSGNFGAKMAFPREYHEAHLVQNVMIVVRGSDGRDRFWRLNRGASRNSGCRSSQSPSS